MPKRARAPSSPKDPDAQFQRIYATVDSIPRGCVATYGQVASEAMLPRRARLVGRALRELPEGSKLAWHRVVGAGGRIRVGGASAREQRRRLVAEGVRVDARGRIDMKRFAWGSMEPEEVVAGGASAVVRGASGTAGGGPPKELKSNGELDDSISRTRSRRGRRSTSARSRGGREGVEWAALARVSDELERHGLLMQQDRELPNVVQIVTGETLRSSWWKHPRAHDVFRVLQELAEDRDVLFTKLVDGKVTLVHRALWPALAAVALERGAWQTRGLSAAAKRLLARVEGESSVEANGAAAKELELRLLVVSSQRHTESGEHALVLETWLAWTKRVRVKPMRDVARARSVLESVALALGASSLPWIARSARGSP